MPWMCVCVLCVDCERQSKSWERTERITKSVFNDNVKGIVLPIHKRSLHRTGKFVATFSCFWHFPDTSQQIKIKTHSHERTHTHTSYYPTKNSGPIFGRIYFGWARRENEVNTSLWHFTSNTVICEFNFASRLPVLKMYIFVNWAQFSMSFVVFEMGFVLWVWHI